VRDGFGIDPKYAEWVFGMFTMGWTDVLSLYPTIVRDHGVLPLVHSLRANIAETLIVP